MANQQKVTEVTEEESNARICRLMKRLDEVTGKNAVEVNKNIVAFVGPTKAGKSTLINCLLGTKLICKMNKDAHETYIVKANDESGPKIGGRGESETESPEYWGNIPGTDYALWDFAGFGDNKGTEQEIMNAISYQTILLKAECVRFVFVLPFAIIKAPDALPLHKLLNELHTICPKVGDSLCMVITKFKKGNVKNLLSQIMSFEFIKTEQENREVISRGINIVEKVYNNSNYIEFNTPKMDKGEDEKSFTLPNKQLIIDKIRQLGGTKVDGFPLVISDQAKLYIHRIHTLFYKAGKKEMTNIISSIEKYIQNKVNEIKQQKEKDGEPESGKSKRDILIKEKTKFDELMEKAKDLKTFFREIKNFKFKINEKSSEIIEKALFAEKLRNSYKSKDSDKSSQEEKEFLLNVEHALTSGKMKYDELILELLLDTIEKKKKMEIEMKKSYDDKLNKLKEQIKIVEKDNESVLVQVSKVLVSGFNYAWNWLTG